ncbi:SLAP domain-containing protein [Lactobacillus sp. CC-MHH1034]|uniref:SLAP domain-containing protein n=1 Tax=Agrilactobacillus fermenti TaxID=2586909 RepID=UPI001E3131EF|nr:SLAP domain-containing protein [Agrilactobacillus fermenti]MCD2256620.1 SLAP domain-containing protein [Agrilactobacillus fermenti]
MKNTAKVKYLGVAAAALLAVAPVAAPAVSSVALPGQTSVAKAAVTVRGTYAVDQKATIAANEFVFGKNSKNPYTDATGTTRDTNTTINSGSQQTPLNVYFDNGQVKRIQISLGWVDTDDFSDTVKTIYLTDTAFNVKTNKQVTVAFNGGTKNFASGTNLSVKGFEVDTKGNVKNYVVSYNGDTGKVDPAVVDYDADSADLTIDNSVPSDAAVVTAKTDDGATIYSNKGTSIPTNTKLAKGESKNVNALVKDKDGKVVAYQIDDNQFVKAGDVNTGAQDVTVNILPGTIVYSDYKSLPVYTDAKATKLSGSYLSTKYNAWKALAVSVNAKGDSIAYKLGENQWVKASDLSDTENTTSDLKISALPANTVMNSNYKAATVYSDATTKKDSGSKLSTDFNQWAAFRVAKDKDGNAVAYDLGDNQWVKASDLDTSSDNSSATTSTLPAGTAVFSNYKAAKVYSEPEGKNATGKLATSVNEWAAFRVAKDDNGNVIAYDLGSNQWVKAADLDTVEAKNGTFYANAGTPLYDRNGGQAGSISATGAYKVFALTYINGKQALKLGSDSQWIMAAAGAYYPA